MFGFLFLLYIFFMFVAVYAIVCGVRKLARSLRISMMGIWLCVTYLVYSGSMLTLGLCLSDYKSSIVFMQLSILLAGLALNAVGALDLLKQMSWIEAYVILNLATFAGLYLLGWCIGRLCNSVLPPEA